MMTYNPPYYARLIENYGFRKTQDLYAFWGHVDMLPKIAEKLGPIAEQIIERYDVKLRPLDTSRFRRRRGDVPDDLQPLAGEHLGLRADVGRRGAAPGRAACGTSSCPRWPSPRRSTAGWSASSFGLPDYNPRIKEIDGRLFPFGFLHLLRNRQAIKRIRLISTNVLPEYQRMGVGLVLMHGLVPKAMEWGLEEAEFSWVLESNSLSYGSLKKGGAKITKTYRLYDCEGQRGEGTRGAGSRGPRIEDSSERRRRLAASSLSADPTFGLGRLHVPALRARWKSARSAAGAISTGSSKLPWRIYAEDPHWVPPLLIEVKEFLNRRKHPFYQHGDATQFIAVRGGETVGRILVSDDPLLQPGARRERRLLRHVRVRRRPRDGPRPAGRRRRLAPRPRPDRRSAARSTIRSTIPAAC